MRTRLSAPTMVSWIIALAVGLLGILNHTRVIHVRIGVDDFWLVAAAFILLLVSTLMRGL